MAWERKRCMNHKAPEGFAHDMIRVSAGPQARKKGMERGKRKRAGPGGRKGDSEGLKKESWVQ